jgi:hypothetical protein
MMYGGNILQGAIIGAAGAAIGYGVGQWGGTPASQGGLGLHHFGQGVLAVMSGGVVGGLSSVAMGGDFWQGFTQGAASAGLSFAANSIANNIEANAKANAESDQAYKDWLAGKRSSPFISPYGYANYGDVAAASPGIIPPNAQNVKGEGPFACHSSECVAYRNWEIQQAKTELAAHLAFGGYDKLIVPLANFDISYSNAHQALLGLFDPAANKGYIFSGMWDWSQRTGRQGWSPTYGPYTAAVQMPSQYALQITVLHEFGHYLNPMWGEAAVMEWTTNMTISCYGINPWP